MEREGEAYVLRPMNCPSHIMIYMGTQHSYRELPIRLAELGTMDRWEKSGQVVGMSRVRIMTLNDAHIFCADAAQVEQKVEAVLHIMEEVYGILGLQHYTYRLSLGDPNNEAKYVKNPPMWEAGEALLRRVLQKVVAWISTRPRTRLRFMAPRSMGRKDIFRFRIPTEPGVKWPYVSIGSSDPPYNRTATARSPLHWLDTKRYSPL
jgi:threonyl-tRNA synthetase